MATKIQYKNICFLNIAQWNEYGKGMIVDELRTKDNLYLSEISDMSWSSGTAGTAAKVHVTWRSIIDNTSYTSRWTQAGVWSDSCEPNFVAEDYFTLSNSVDLGLDLTLEETGILMGLILSCYIVAFAFRQTIRMFRQS
ncbi:MAG: hypothetical protein CMP91_13170 [Gammaproteobacteria bacterium]|nr:hypothetical protein [Gammaproteobacteria bacterium]|tara:strand:- start:11383 stop:11799 length:417 start_codon:yes stop_codon:yes gene_type:complete